MSAKLSASKYAKRPDFIYIGRASCGCCLALVNDYGDKSTGKAVAEFIAGGLTVERISWQEYQEKVSLEEGFMNCIHETRQGALF